MEKIKKKSGYLTPLSNLAADPSALTGADLFLPFAWNSKPACPSAGGGASL